MKLEYSTDIGSRVVITELNEVMLLVILVVQNLLQNTAVQLLQELNGIRNTLLKMFKNQQFKEVIFAL